VANLEAKSLRLPEGHSVGPSSEIDTGAILEPQPQNEVCRLIISGGLYLGCAIWIS
jgi:hypothetical protein